MQELLEYTPSQAIRAIKGMYRRKLYEMLNNGEISCIGGQRQKLIHASELARVFGGDFTPLTEEQAQQTSQGTFLEQKERQEHHADSLENKMFLKEHEQLHQRLGDKDRFIHALQEQLQQLQGDRDHWRHQATYLLEDKSKKEGTIHAHIEEQQAMREKLARQEAEKEQLTARLNETQNSLEKVRASRLGRLLFRV